jgi:hypothetical protein
MKAITANNECLANLVKMRIGAPFRERIVHQHAGTYRVVQGKDVGSDGNLVPEGMVRLIEVPGRGAPDLLSAGEVVLQTRGSSYRAAVVPQSDIPMVAAGSLYILAPNAACIEPEYLVFFLNLPSTQATLRQLATGSTILNLRRAAVEQLEVPLPSLADQRRLVELGRLVRKQSDIAERLNHLRLQELFAIALRRAKSAGGLATPPSSKRPEKRGNAPRRLENELGQED